MARILFYDCETDSLDHQHGHIMELGWATYDIDSKRLLSAKSRLLKWNTHYEVDHGAFLATGLSREFCEAHGSPVPEVFAEFLSDCAQADFVGGHNILGFDHLIVTSNVQRALFGKPVQLLERLAIDTYLDVPYPETQKIHALKYLALDHGHIMSSAHQALADVFASAHIFFQYPFEKCLEIAKTPIVLLHCYTDYFDKDSRDKLYNLKFRWNRERKRWEKRTRAFFVPGTQLELKVNLYSDDQIVMDVPAHRSDNEPGKSEELPF